jgi:hypothetical protein
MAQHVGAFNQLVRVLWWLLSDLLSFELVKVIFVLLVAPFAETKVVTGGTVKAEFAPLDGFLTAIASEPSLILLLEFLFNVFLHRPN